MKTDELLRDPAETASEEERAAYKAINRRIRRVRLGLFAAAMLVFVALYYAFAGG